MSGARRRDLQLFNATLSGLITNAWTEEATPTQILVSWDELDPLAIHMSFVPDGHLDSIDWVFGRDLLMEAFASTDKWVGEGDVTLRAMFTGQLMVSLISPEGAARVTMESRNIAGLFQESCRAIAPSSPEEAAVYSGQFDIEIDEITL